jgi:acetyl-CoA carboxylase carboxyltransferase component
MKSSDLDLTIQQALAGGQPKYHEKNSSSGKLFARQRLLRLLDDPSTIPQPHEASFVEDGLLANVTAGDLPADGVITGVGRIGGRAVAIMANDSTVKAGSWGQRTVEKILRIQETALREAIPLLYLVDSAGARITDQVDLFPGRRGAGRIFYNQVALSGVVPQICLLFGPSAAGGAYIPAFCDIVVMVDGNASMYLGSPRMAEMVTGERVSLEDMGGAKMHTSVSGCADVLVTSESEALEFAKRYLAYFPSNAGQLPPAADAADAASACANLESIVVADETKPFDMQLVIDTIIDQGSLVELKSRFAREIITGLARIQGKVIGVVANQPQHLGGVLFTDSADKAARFISLCDAFNIPLLFLADVPGFMIGSKVERQGIIRSGAKMIAAVSEATVPKLSIIVRKAYGAGLYAMCGPAFDPLACLALPTASIAVMGPQAAVNAVYYNKLQEVPEGAERDALVKQLRDEYRRDIDILKLASNLVVDGILPFDRLRDEIHARFSSAQTEPVARRQRKHLVMPM